LAEVPEEVVVTIEADDRATPALTSVGRSIVLLGANLAYVTRELGIQNPVLDRVINGILLIGHVVRAAAAAKTLLGMATHFLTASEVSNVGATFASSVQWQAYSVMAGEATVANYGLATSFAALNAAMGPIGWALLAIGLGAAAIGGYALAGGFSPHGGGGMPAVGGGPYAEPMVNIQVNVEKLATREDIEETVHSMATSWYRQTRRYKG